MIPSVGRIVHYRLTEQDANRINQDIAAGTAQGNSARAGDVFPLLITRTWGDSEGSAVNGQVMLDGNGSLWVTSVTEGDGQRQWFAPPRV